MAVPAWDVEADVIKVTLQSAAGVEVSLISQDELEVAPPPPAAALRLRLRRAVRDEAECRARALEELAEHVIASVSSSLAR